MIYIALFHAARSWPTPGALSARGEFSCWCHSRRITMRNEVPRYPGESEGKAIKITVKFRSKADGFRASYVL
jgi:hypothetical protein